MARARITAESELGTWTFRSRVRACGFPLHESKIIPILTTKMRFISLAAAACSPRLSHRTQIATLSLISVAATGGKGFRRIADRIGNRQSIDAEIDKYVFSCAATQGDSVPKEGLAAEGHADPANVCECGIE